MISKSTFLNYLVCPKNLWLDLKKPEIGAPLDDLARNNIETGIEVGKLARTYFNNTFIAQRVDKNGKPDLEGQIEATKLGMSQGFTSIAEASFMIDDLFCAVDLLVKDTQSDGWIIYEVKASNEYKKEHFYDVAFQKYVLEKCGIQISHMFVMHLNKLYIRKGDIDVHQLFAFDEIDNNEEVLFALENIEYYIPFIREMMNLKDEPEQEFSGECKTCPFHDYCTRNLPDNNISQLSNIRAKKAYDLINHGIITMGDYLATGEAITRKRQKVQLEALSLGKDRIIDVPAIKKFVDSLSYPLYHLDFETMMEGIPPFDGAHSYESIPFQYSLHIEMEKNGPYIHKEFLGEKLNCDYELAKQLIEDIPANACLIAFHSSTEEGVIRNLAKKFPNLSEELLLRVTNVIDLLDPFVKGDFYDAKQKGSNSIKKVMPALCPHMEEAYHELPVVHNGGEALSMFPKLVKMTGEEYKTTRTGMLKYCELDTWSMVEILKVLYKIAE